MIGVYQQENLDLYNVVGDAIENALNLTSQDAGSFSLPSNTHNPLRQQYDANSILIYIAKKDPDKFNLRIALVKVDIYTQGMNFIFGLADPLRETALVSTFRLDGDKAIDRISKEVIHEMGHLLGLGHCSNRRCIMSFSNTIKDTDNKNIDFCSKCRGGIE